MAEARRFADLKYGHAGNLTYLPRLDDAAGGEAGILHTSRLTWNVPHLKQIGSSAELYAGSKSREPAPTHTHLGDERNLQRRWLLKSHPEAFTSNSLLSGWLKEESEHFRKLDNSPRPQNLLAMGEMTDLSIPSRPTIIPVLAAATGESGELLRLARVEDSKWRWEDDRNSTLQISVIDPMDADDEVIWASDGLPISRIKFVTSITPDIALRWLVVQKETSTTILSPEYTKVPVAENKSSYMRLENRLSRVQPNQLLTLSHQETGGNAHSDFAFNPAVGELPPQLCIVDECGYWTLWNVAAFSRTDKKNTRLSLYRCGHMWEGSLNSIPSSTQYPAEHHGVLFTGVGDNLSKTSSDRHSGRASLEVPTARSRYVLQWNSDTLEISDTESDAVLPKLPEFSTAKAKFDRILDIQTNPSNQDEIFIMTARFIVWVQLFPTFEKLGAQSKPRILLTCPHNAGDEEKLKMTICSLSPEGTDTLVSVYSSQGSQVVFMWFWLNPENGLPQWYSQATTLSQDFSDNENSNGFQELILRPLKLVSHSRASGLGSRYLKAGVQFFQGMLLHSDLSIQYCICYSSRQPGLDVTLPVAKVGWTESKQNRKWKKKRLQLLRHMEGTVVIPDHMTDDAMMTLSRRPRTKEEELDESLGRLGIEHEPRPVEINFDRFFQAMRDRLNNTTDQGRKGLSIDLLEAIQGVLQDGHASGRLPLKTWREISDHVVLGEGEDILPAHEAGTAIDDFVSGIDQGSTLLDLTNRSGNEPSRSPQSFAVLQDHLIDVWVEPVKGLLSAEQLLLRQSWANELAHEIFLSSLGVLIQDVPLFDPMPVESQQSQHVIPSSFPVPSSQVSFPTLPSPPPSTTDAGGPDEAFQRLQLLAPSLHPGKIGNTKQAAVLSYWPTERGIDTEGYVSSVAIATDKKFDEARQRLQKIEAKRKAMNDKYKRPARPGHSSPIKEEKIRTTVRPGAPTQIQSSQQAPSSSQTQAPPIAMSQPVSGAFGGDRKKPKKAKKRSGFR